EQLTWAANKNQEASSRPEALVKGITPARPAPISATASAAPAVTAQGPGLIKRLINWLTGTSAPAVKEEPKTEASSKPQGGRGKNSRHGERRERGQGDRNNRNRRGERRHDKDA